MTIIAIHWSSLEWIKVKVDVPWYSSSNLAIIFQFYYYFSADFGVVPQPQSVLPFESRFEKERKKRVCCVCLVSWYRYSSLLRTVASHWRHLSAKATWEDLLWYQLYRTNLKQSNSHYWDVCQLVQSVRFSCRQIDRELSDGMAWHSESCDRNSWYRISKENSNICEKHTNTSRDLI